MTARGDVVTVLDGLQVVLDSGSSVSVTAYESLPDQIQPYTAWTVWVSTTWLSRCVDESTWQVLLALAGGTSDAWLIADQIIGPVRDALSKVGGVMRCEPVLIPSGDGGAAVPALAFTLNANR